MNDILKKPEAVEPEMMAVEQPDPRIAKARASDFYKAVARPGWEHTFMEVARAMALRATCRRKRVGAVITLDNRIIATGYNGAPSGEPHCIDAGNDCDIQDGHCVRTVHAEMNALLQAECSIKGATVYTTASPCWECFRVLLQAGAERFIYAEDYRNNASNERIQRALKARPTVSLSIMDDILCTNCRVRAREPAWVQCAPCMSQLKTDVPLSR